MNTTLRPVNVYMAASLNRLQFSIFVPRSQAPAWECISG